MPLKPSDIVSFGAFVLGGLTYMKAKKKTVAWLLIAVGIVALFMSAFSRTNEESQNAQVATTHGNNSPALTQSGTASGSNTSILQVGRDLIQIASNSPGALQIGGNLNVAINAPKSRLFTVAAAKRMIEALKRTKGIQYSVENALNCGEETQSLTSQVDALFYEAGFTPSGQLTIATTPWRGVEIIIPDAREGDQTLRAALNGFFEELGQKPRITTHAAGTMRIMVGGAE